MAKPKFIELGELQIPILYEDRSVIAIDKPVDWLLVPDDWKQTSRNLQAAINDSIAMRDFWAHSRNLHFLRYVHRLDAETSGVLLCVKNPGAMPEYSRLFESRQMEKVYLAGVHDEPRQQEWTCREPLGPALGKAGRMKVDTRTGKPAETRFRVLESKAGRALIEARPFTGRTHQIRVHLAHTGHAVLGDSLYRPLGKSDDMPFALRAVALSYTDPFTRRRVHITAPTEEFLRTHGFGR